MTDQTNETSSSTTNAPMKIEDVTKGITLDTLLDVGFKSDFACLKFNNISTDRDPVINIPVVKEDPVAYFLEEGEKADLDTPFKTEVKTLKLGVIVCPNYISYQHRFNLDHNKPLQQKLLSTMSSRLFDKIDQALFNSTDVSKSNIQSIFAHADSNNAMTITSDINDLYSFVAKLEPYQQRNATMYMSQVTYNNLVKHLFLANENFILNTQDITKDRDLSILGIKIVISSHVATNKIVYMTNDSYLFGFSKKIELFEQESAHGNVIEQTLITLVGGQLLDNRNTYIGTISAS